MMYELIKASSSLSLTELVDLILDKTGMKQELESENSIEAEARLENLEEFKSITKSFEDKYGVVSLEEFLNEISLVSDIEEHKDEVDVVTLMTVHSAKGLEFKYVFIIGLEEGIFPHARSMFDDDELEEERRLCYVAVTRAKERLWVVCASHRMLFGDSSNNPPSRFIKEISDEYLDKDIVKSKKIVTNIISDGEYCIGDIVNHTEFGEGVIVAVEKSILTIAFPHPYGIKKIMKGHKSLVKV